VKAAAIQMNAGQNEEANLEKALRLIDEAARQGAVLAALPEYFHYMGPNEDKYAHSHSLDGSLLKTLQGRAAEHGIYILGGSFLETSPTEGLCYNTSPLISPDGSIPALYRKIHLFDVDIADTVRFKESEIILPGSDTVVADTPHGRWGISICYDLRFPELYRSMTLRGAELIFVPSAFALFTGKDHWEVLLRARAIENQVYIVAPNQFGLHNPNFQSYGNSMIVDPWGTVLARAPEGEGIITAELDRERLAGIREKLPSLKHRSPHAYQ